MLLFSGLLTHLWLAAASAAPATERPSEHGVLPVRTILALADAERGAWRRDVRALTRAWGRDDAAARQNVEASLRTHLERLRNDLTPEGAWRPADAMAFVPPAHAPLRDAVLHATLADRTEHDDAVRARVRAWIIVEASWDAYVRRLDAVAAADAAPRRR